jgi:hypothetical protein
MEASAGASEAAADRRERGRKNSISAFIAQREEDRLSGFVDVPFGSLASFWAHWSGVGYYPDDVDSDGDGVLDLLSCAIRSRERTAHVVALTNFRLK